MRVRLALLNHILPFTVFAYELRPEHGAKIPAIKKDRSQGGGERPAFGLKRMGSVSKDCAISFKWARRGELLFKLLYR